MNRVLPALLLCSLGILPGCPDSSTVAQPVEAASRSATPTYVAPSAIPPPHIPNTTLAKGAASSFAEPIVELPHALVYTPPNLLPGERRPLLLVLHGLGATAKIAYNSLGLARIGAERRVFVVAPNGRKDSKGRQFWNAHPACCDFGATGVDDVARLRSLIDEAVAVHPIDPAAVYVLGFSNGGFMAHRLACEIGPKLAGIASVAGAGPDSSARCQPTTKLAVMEVHGDADDVVRYEGGALFGRALPTHGSARTTLADWGKRLGCKGEPQAGTALDLAASLPGRETSVLEYSACVGGRATLLTMHGGTHYTPVSATVVEAALNYFLGGK